MTEKIEEKIKILLKKEKKYNEVIKICDKILDKNKEDENAYYYRGIAKWSLHKYKEAGKDFDRVLELNHNNKNSYIYTYRGLAKLKDFKEIIKCFNTTIFNINDYKNNQKKYKEAIEDFNKAIELDQNNAFAYLGIGMIKGHFYQYKEAIENFNKAIDIYYNLKGAYFYNGLFKSKLEMYEEAIKDYNKLIDFDPHCKEAYNNRGTCKNRLKLYKEAIEDFNKAIELNPKCYYAYYNRYISEYNLGEYKKAIKDFEKLIELLKKLKLIEKYNLDINFIVIMFIDIMQIVDTECVFELIKKNYNELFENNTIFKLLKNKIESKNISNKDDIFNNIKNTLLYKYLLLKSLSFSINDNIEISHYTSLNTLLLLLNDKKEEKENRYNEGKIRIVNISNANDPKEGKILESIFYKNGLDIKISNNEENLITLQTSYTRNKDSLTMFRLYGKNENKEATGVCLVIDKEYFSDKYLFPPAKIHVDLFNNLNNVDNDKYLNNDLEEQDDNAKKNLYWILYYNEKENQLIFNPNNSKYENIIINLDNIEELKNEYEAKKCKITLNDKKEIIEYIFSNIYFYTKKLDKEIKNKELKIEIFSNLFENIKYIIKDESFFEEQELRMLTTRNYEDKYIEIDNDNKRLYINYLKLFDENNNYINEIILGSKVENAESMVEYIKKVLNDKYEKEGIKKKDIKVSISKAPLR